MTLDQTLERRLKRLEDLEEIRTLQSTYGHYCDKGWNDKEMYVDKIPSLFVEDATWDCPAFMIAAKGLEEIRQAFVGLDEFSDYYMHSFSNSIIDMEGDTATAKWLMLLGCTMEGKTTLCYCSYNNVYVRASGGWKIKSMYIDVAAQI